MNFEIQNRVITGDEEFLVGDNADYTAKFTFDKEWAGVTKTARFIQKGSYKDVLLVDDQCLVPVELLKNGYLVVGVYSSTMTTTEHRVVVKRSIKEESGNVSKPTPNIYEQLTRRLDEILKQVVENLDYDVDPVTGLVRYKAETGTYETIKPDTEITEESKGIPSSGAVYNVFSELSKYINKGKKLLVSNNFYAQTEEEWLELFNYENHNLNSRSFIHSEDGFNEKPKVGDYYIGAGTVRGSQRGNVIFIGIIYSYNGRDMYRSYVWAGAFVPQVPKSLSQLINDGDGTSPFATEQFVKDNSNLGVIEETDPTVPTHVKNITEDNITKWNNDVTQTQLDNAIKAVAGQNEYIGSYANSEYTAETIQTELSNFVAAQTNPNREKRNGDIVNIVNGIYGGQQWIYSSNEAVWKYYIDFDNHSVIDNLTSDSTIDGLSARQGKLIKEDLETTKEDLETNYVKKDAIALTLKDNGAYTLTINK